MQITLALKPNAAALGETERHECFCSTTAAAEAAQPSCKSPLSRLARRKQAPGWQLGKEERGDHGIRHNQRREIKSNRQNKRKYVLKLEESQSERNRCGQVDKR